MELCPVFARRLYLALLVESLERPNIPKLIEKTGWPRRTIEDVIKAMPGIGIELNFVQDGRRHNDGYYQLSDWGPFDSQWVTERKRHCGKLRLLCLKPASLAFLYPHYAAWHIMQLGASAVWPQPVTDKT